jgi:hypothetical protein
VNESHDKDKRQEARYPTNDTVTVSVAPFQEKHTGKILNVSRHGVQLELDCPLQNRDRIEILTPAGVAIFGEIRYCKRAGEVFHIGVLIHDAVFAKPPTGKHIDDDQLSLYLAGHGLSASEVLRAKEHLDVCSKCRTALDDTSELNRRMRRPPPE